MRNDGQFKTMLPPKQKAVRKVAKKEGKIPLLTDTQKGLISIGLVAGAALAISKKKSLLVILGYMWLGSMAGGGIAYFLKKNGKLEK
jgi:hypothetical protein